MKPIPFLLILSVMLPACLPSSLEAYPQPTWKYADLRLIDPVDSLSAGTDLTAVYLREHAGELQIRLDFLELDTVDDFDLKIAFNTVERGSTGQESGWEFWISARDGEAVESWQTDGIKQRVSGLRIVRDTRYDTIVISLEKESLQITRTGFQMGVFLTKPGTSEVLDEAAPISSNAPPPAPVPVLFAFWNTLNAATPAQALRAWDGAHSGPFYDRHGLKYLIQAASEWDIPIALLDLGDPRSLAALDFVDGIVTVFKAAEEGIISLPLVSGISLGTAAAPIPPDEWALQMAYQESTDVRASFNLPGSLFHFSTDEPWQLYNAGGRIKRPDLIVSVDKNKPSSVLTVECVNWQGTNLLMLPNKPAGDMTEQTTDAGLTLETRIALVSGAAALDGVTGYSDPCQGPVLFLGGDLAQSAWADPESVRQGFDYISSRPWIRPVTLADIAAGKANSVYYPSISEEPIQDNLYSTSGSTVYDSSDPSHLQNIILDAIRSAPPGVLTEAAWQMFASLAAPALYEDDAYYQIRTGYRGQIGYLLEGARWASLPFDGYCTSDSYSIAENGSRVCTYTSDLDWDGEAEIVLASDKFLAVVEQAGGYAAVLFYRDEKGIHQIAAPASQLATGLSDPMTWKLEQGAGAEPELPRGLFSDIREGWVEPSWEPMAYKLEGGEVIFYSDDGTLTKTITLTGNGIQAVYQADSGFKVQNVAALDPWHRFEPGWSSLYNSEQIPDGWVWKLEQGPRVELTAHKVESSEAGTEDIKSKILSYLSALPNANRAEDPFIDYGAGYFLPFPLAIVEMEAEGAFVVELSVTSEQ